jgi:hypothetical protein
VAGFDFGTPTRIAANVNAPNIDYGVADGI